MHQLLCGGVAIMKRWVLVFLIAVSWQILPENGHSQGTHNAEVNAENANEAGNNKPFSIPVRILEAPLPEPDHEQDREQRGRQEAREEENLATQKSIAEVSEKLSHYTLYQLWLSIASAFGLTLTVVFAGLAWKESKASTNIAKQALAVTQDTAKKQLRAHLVLTGTAIPADTPEGFFVVRSGFKNCGQTPAMIKKIGRKAFLTNQLTDECFDDLVMHPFVAIVGPGEPLNFFMGEPSQPFPDLRRHVAAGSVIGAMRICAIYTDIFGEDHEIEFTRILEGKRELNSDFGISFNYPDKFE